METIDNLYKEWQALQPLSSENQRRLDQKFMLEFNYNSNHLEGNTLTYGQTKLLLMFGTTSGDAKLRDYEEMKAHNVGLELVKREATDKERPLTESFIRELNRTILVENFHKTQKNNGQEFQYEVKVGQYKIYPNSVETLTGEIFEYASPEETPALMADLVQWYNEEEKKGELCPMQLAALLHYRYIRIHPFDDGNGRIARLLMNYVLFRHGFPMIIVRSSDKENYLNALNKSDVQVGLSPSDGAHASLKQIEPFLEYMEEQLRYAFDISIKAAKGESIEEEDDFAKRLTLLQREAKEKNKEKANQTQSRVEQIRGVFNQFYIPLRKKINSALDSVAIMFYQQKWDESCLSKDENSKNAVRIENIEDYVNNVSDPKAIKKLSESKAVFFKYILRYPKEEYKMLPGVIGLGFTITFEEEYYSINKLDNKKFSYNTYPSDEETANIVSLYKISVLNKIEDAIHGKLQ